MYTRGKGSKQSVVSYTHNGIFLLLEGKLPDLFSLHDKSWVELVGIVHCMYGMPACWSIQD